MGLKIRVVRIHQEVLNSNYGFNSSVECKKLVVKWARVQALYSRNGGKT